MSRNWVLIAFCLIISACNNIAGEIPKTNNWPFDAQKVTYRPEDPNSEISVIRLERGDISNTYYVDFKNDTGSKGKIWFKKSLGPLVFAFAIVEPPSLSLVFNKDDDKGIQIANYLRFRSQDADFKKIEIIDASIDCDKQKVCEKMPLKESDAWNFALTAQTKKDSVPAFFIRVE